MLAIALADEDIGWATWLDECWMRASTQQQVIKTGEFREAPYWVVITVDRGEDAVRFSWRIAGYRYASGQVILNHAEAAARMVST